MQGPTRLEGVELSGTGITAGVIDGHDPSDTGAGSRTGVLRKSSTHS